VSAAVESTRRIRRLVARSRGYRGFALSPGTLFTIASGLLLVVATVQNPCGLISGESVSSGSFSLYLAAAIVGSSYIWWSAVQGIRRRDFTADIPVSIATAAAIAIGQYPSAAVVAVLLLLGGLLERFVAARAGKAVDALAKLLPDQVTVRLHDGDVAVPLEKVRAGDVLLVKSGERIAVDGEVMSGTATIDQSAITGESMPIEVQVGNTVLAGCLSQLGTIEIRALKVGQETTLGHIRRMVEEAQTKRAPIERLLNRYAMFYTPIALILGAFLWWWSGDVLRAITVLIVFCPCVMVLATPTALVASIGNAALRGSLVKKGAIVEELAKVDTVVFDKTGTVTCGKLKLARVVPLDRTASVDLLTMAATAEKFSEHPLGRAVVQAAVEDGYAVPDPDRFETVPGLGVKALVNGRLLVIGRTQFLLDNGIAIPPTVADIPGVLAGQASTTIAVAADGKMVGLLVFEDTLRSEARESISRIRQLGMRVVLATGDNHQTANRVAAQLGIDEVIGDMMPEQKVELVRRLQSRGRIVAFVGDGVNDGPALAAANVGIAMGLAGTDVAIETAGVALLSDDLSKLPHLFRLSGLAIKAIRQNLAFALAVLAIAIGLTIPGILMPATGALLHELSSIPVIANSARLIGIKDHSQ
jgi:Zn2+/Cd2+-exporting ATPase